VQRFRHIAIEGPIGAGKSSLARKLAAHLRAETLLEKPEENPFLARFYEDGSRYALQTQLFFLFQRVEQYRALAQPGMFSPRIVSDFMFAKDALFARLTLSDDEYRLYLQIHQQVAASLPPPDRIQRRGIDMEQAIPDAYLDRLSQAYAEHFERDPGLPVLAVRTDGFNPLAVDADFDRLLQAVQDFQGPRQSLSHDCGPPLQPRL
jgi:deoxyguanosine kinase